MSNGPARLVVLAGVAWAAFGQSRPAMDPAMVGFFAGTWNCAGEFASGKKIEADLSFTAELDGAWLLYRHTDRPPGRFQALSMWGVDRTSGRWISSMQDSSGAIRLFTSDGWKGNTLTFESAGILERAPARQRFRYERQAPDSFKMTYETGSQEGQWKLGDYLVCRKVAAPPPKP